MKTCRIIFTAFIIAGLLALFGIILQPFLHAQPLPVVVPYYDAKAYAWLWNGSAWQLLPRNEARILYHEQGNNKQLTGTLTIDGCYDVPVVSGQNVLLVFRKEGNFKTHAGLPDNESGIEVTKLDVRDGLKKGTLIRTAQLTRRGEAAATFGEKREPITVQKIENPCGVYHVIRVAAPLAPGRYALYLPDRAFEFAVQ